MAAGQEVPRYKPGWGEQTASQEAGDCGVCCVSTSRKDGLKQIPRLPPHSAWEMSWGCVGGCPHFPPNWPGVIPAVPGFLSQITWFQHPLSTGLWPNARGASAGPFLEPSAGGAEGSALLWCLSGALARACCWRCPPSLELFCPGGH